MVLLHTPIAMMPAPYENVNTLFKKITRFRALDQKRRFILFPDNYEESKIEAGRVCGGVPSKPAGVKTVSSLRYLTCLKAKNPAC
jgi:hypothetical protein